jgi:hypothetical protein
LGKRGVGGSRRNEPQERTQDATSLKAVQQWLADPRFASLHPNLERIETRLAGFVQMESQEHVL